MFMFVTIDGNEQWHIEDELITCQERSRRAVSYNDGIAIKGESFSSLIERLKYKIQFWILLRRK